MNIQQFGPRKQQAFSLDKAKEAIPTKSPGGFPQVKNVIRTKEQPQFDVSWEKFQRIVEKGNENKISADEIRQEIESRGKKIQEKPTFIRAVKGFAEERAQNVLESQEAGQKQDQTIFETGVQMAGEGAGLVGDALGEAMVRGLKSVWKVTPKYMKDNLSRRSQAVLELPVTQKGIKALVNGVDKYNDWAEENPRAARNLAGVYNIGELALDLYSGGAAGKATKKGFEKTIKGAGKVAGAVVEPVAKGTEKLTTGVLGLTTGTSPDTIRTALKTAGTDDFLKGLRGQIDETNVLDTVKKGITNLRDDRRTLYGEGYDKLLEVADNIDIEDVRKTALGEIFGEKGFKIKLDGKDLIFDGSTVSRGSPQKKVIENLLLDLTKRDDYTPAGLDTLRKRLDDYWRGTAEYAQTDRLITNIRNKINDKITEAVPEYAEMNAKYSQLTNLLRDVEGALGVGGKKQTSTAITKLKGALRRNQEFRQVMLNELQRYADGDFMAQLAGTALSDRMPRGLAGVLAGGAAVLNPNLLAGFAAASPRVIGELANIVGISVKKVKSAIKNAASVVKKTDSLLNKSSIDALPFDLSTAISSISNSESLDIDK